MRYEVPSYNFFEGEEFERVFDERLDFLQQFADVDFTPVGNPFVDSGILAIDVIMNIDNPMKITLKDALHSFTHINGQDTKGNEFTYRNTRVKSLSLTLLNNPLQQASWGMKEIKGKHPAYLKPNEASPSPLQNRMYRAYMIEFLINYGRDKTTKNNVENYCVICGIRTLFEFNELETKFSSYVKGSKDNFGAGPTRSWFPLIGSIGSSAQSLPTFTETHHICGKCLFSVQFLPQITNLYRGKLACFQSDNYRFTKNFIARNLDHFNESLLQDPTKKVDIVGKKDDSLYFALMLLDNIENYYGEYDKMSLTMWLFNNIGTNPSCSYVNYPYETLEFLYQVMNELNVKSEILGYLRTEKKYFKFSNRYFLINSITSKSDYRQFYKPTTVEAKHLPSQEFYNFYQINIRNWSIDAIRLVRQISQQLKIDTETDKINRILQSGKQVELRNLVFPKILSMYKDSLISIKAILDLFSTQYKKIPNRSPWKLFEFYLHPNLQITEISDFSIDKDSMDNIYNFNSLGFLNHFAVLAREINEKKSSFEESNYFKKIGRYFKKDLEIEYIKVGKNTPGYTWNRFQNIFIKMKYYEVFFYFRLFSIENNKQSDFDGGDFDRNKLIYESGLHPELLDTLINYIQIRSGEIGSKRIFTELTEDLRKGNYSAKYFYKILNEKMKANNLQKLMEYSFFTELDASREFSWATMKEKLRLFIYQYFLMTENEGVPTLIKQIKEEN